MLIKKKILIIVPVLVGLILGAFIYNSSTHKLEVGDIAPNISMLSPSGEVIELKSLRGQYVVVDFWASWCSPCRKENQNLVRAYNKYRQSRFVGSKGFTVYSVSLDTDGQIWKKAIENDKLVWPNHVCDFKKWDTNAAIEYGVRSIPSMFLVDPEGKIVATDLFGIDLENEFEKLLEK